MAKAIATKWKVMVNNVDLSNHATNVDIADEKEKIDVSGFGGTSEFLPGVRTQTVTVTFLNDFAAASTYATIKPLYEGGSVFPFFVLPDSSIGTSATNPLYGGSAACYSFPSSGELNNRMECEIEFSPGVSAGFSWGTVAP